jgi:hypothetical protein
MKNNKSMLYACGGLTVDNLTTYIIWEESIAKYFKAHPGICLDGPRNVRKIFSVLLEIRSMALPNTSQTYCSLDLLSLWMRIYMRSIYIL